MAVTVGNIIVGAGTLSVDGTDVGGTRDGVQMAREAEYLDVTADQHKAVLKKYITAERRFLRTSLLEATLDNLKLAWGGTVEDNTLKLSLNDELEEHELEFTGPGPNGKTRKYKHSRAVQIGNAEHSYTKNGETVIPVEFEILADLSKPGAEWGTVIDS